MIDLRQPTFTQKVAFGELKETAIQYLLYGADIEEERASTIAEAFSGNSSTRLCRIEQLDDAYCRFHLDGSIINLFEADQLALLLSEMHGQIAVDLTSLENRIWAPVTKALIRNDQSFVALYAEPDDYRRSEDLPGLIYDLSLSRGIDPLPGFARVSRRAKDQGHFVPLLGFEGARLSHIFDQEEVEIAHSYPIIGSPGFRVEYPTITYVANHDVLSQDHMDQRVELAQASCPFEAYRAIERIHAHINGKHLRIAPIGTKPHALGSILYAIQHPMSTEIVYDNPIRSRGRTVGTRGVYVYEVSAFIANAPGEKSV